MLHTSPLPHDVPGGKFVYAVVLVAGWQDWQEFAVFTAPEATVVAPMTHWVPHWPLEHT